MKVGVLPRSEVLFVGILLENAGVPRVGSLGRA